MTNPASELAPAKVNLTLHVTGRRSDGLHTIDSIVVFPRLGDVVRVEPGRGLSLRVEGPFAQDIVNETDNLVLRAATLIRRRGRGAILRLTKSLPVASGLGGGSSDAAATLRLLARIWQTRLPEISEVQRLGADVPVCIGARSVRMRGIGEVLEPLAIPTFWIVLVNPGVPVATGAVFAALSEFGNLPMPDVPGFSDAGALFDFLAEQRNDLEAAAAAIEPSIADVLGALTVQRGCRLARMSGSGASCFGLFLQENAALEAREALRRERGSWWVVAAPVHHETRTETATLCDPSSGYPFDHEVGYGGKVVPKGPLR